MVSIKIGEQISDKITLEPAKRDFELNFAAKIEWRNEVSLILDEVQKAGIRFFTEATQLKKLSLNFSFPNLETRMLSQYLRNQGETVNEEIQVFRDSKIQTIGVKQDTV